MLGFLLIPLCTLPESLLQAACEAGCSSQALALYISPAGWRGNGNQLELPWKVDAGEESTKGVNAVKPSRATLGKGQVQQSPAEEASVNLPVHMCMY